VTTCVSRWWRRDEVLTVMPEMLDVPLLASGTAQMRAWMSGQLDVGGGQNLSLDALGGGAREVVEGCGRGNEGCQAGGAAVGKLL
jgi:hypothetical protein